MKAKVYNLVILDKSGSMNVIRDAAVSGLNETIGSVKALAEKFGEDQPQFITLVAFCGCGLKYMVDNMPASEVQLLTSKDYVPCCNTPLFDAIGVACSKLHEQIKNVEGAIAQVTIITDGMENSSKEYSAGAVRKLISDYKKEGWSFAYIGANQNVEEVGAMLNISNTLCFAENVEDAKIMFARQNRARRNWNESVLDAINYCMDENYLKKELSSMDGSYFKDTDKEDDDKKK